MVRSSGLGPWDWELESEPEPWITEAIIIKQSGFNSQMGNAGASATEAASVQGVARLSRQGTQQSSTSSVDVGIRGIDVDHDGKCPVVSSKE